MKKRGVTLLPAFSNDYITFGCFQNLSKITPKVLSLWASILRALPTSRLRIKNKEINNPETRHLQDYDVSQSFIHTVDTLRQQLEPNVILESKIWTTEQQQALQQQSKAVIQYFSQQFGVSNINRIKVGIAEATRAVMRRVPEHIFVKNKAVVAH